MAVSLYKYCTAEFLPRFLAGWASWPDLFHVDGFFSRQLTPVGAYPIAIPRRVDEQGRPLDSGGVYTFDPSVVYKKLRVDFPAKVLTDFADQTDPIDPAYTNYLEMGGTRITPNRGATWKDTASFQDPFDPVLPTFVLRFPIVYLRANASTPVLI